MADPTRKALTVFRILRHYWRHFRHFPHYWIPLLVLTPIGAFLNNFAISYIIAGVIDRLSQGRIPLADVWNVFGQDIILLVACTVLGELVVWRLLIWLLWRLEAMMVERLYADCFDHLSGQPQVFFSDRFVGSLVSTVNKFTNSYITFVDTVVFSVLPLLTAIVVTIAVLAPVAPLYAAGVAVVSTLFIAISIVTYRPLSRLVNDEAEAHTAISGRLADVLSNILVVKSFAREVTERRGFGDQVGEHRTATLRLMSGHIRRDIGFGIALTGLVTVTLLAILVGQASGLSVGTLIVMLTFSMSLFGQLWNVTQVTRSYNRVIGDATPMVELFEVTSTINDPDRPEHPRIAAGNIRFRDLTFTYPGAHAQLFSGMSLDIPAGQRVGLVGASGSGKTSITRLLLRFFDVDSGAVLIDGQDIRDITQQALRSRIAFVPQEPLLFHRSIAENIRYGRPGATDDEVTAAAQRAQVMEFVEDLPDGLATLVGERGVKLSGGQRQRVAIARAIVSDAPILVLDEATSALDSLSEARIQVALEQAMQGRTTIAIAHRLSTLQSMSRLIVLDHGRVVEDGPHDALIVEGGVYADMWGRQSGGFVTN